jgi:hypothetical protein
LASTLPLIEIFGACRTTAPPFSTPARTEIAWSAFAAVYTDISIDVDLLARADLWGASTASAATSIAGIGHAGATAASALQTVNNIVRVCIASGTAGGTLRARSPIASRNSEPASTTAAGWIACRAALPASGSVTLSAVLLILVFAPLLASWAAVAARDVACAPMREPSSTVIRLLGGSWTE